MHVSTVNHVLLELYRRLTNHSSDTPRPLSHLEFFTGAKGNLLKAYFPKGVIKVGSDLDYSDRGICQNSLLAFNLVKTAAPVSCAKVSSIFGMGCVLRNTFSISTLRSTQILTEPDFFGSTAQLVHQCVGFFTLEITPISSIRFSSSRTFSMSGRGTFLGGHKA